MSDNEAQITDAEFGESLVTAALWINQKGGAIDGQMMVEKEDGTEIGLFHVSIHNAAMCGCGTGGDKFDKRIVN